MSFRIDERIRSHITPLRPEERKLLEENILNDGCRSPLVTWNGLLLDGHNRYEICSANGIPFAVEEIELPDFDAAIGWIEDNQLGRRNLTADQFAYFIGRKYERAKRGHGGAREASAQNEHLKEPEKTADKIASEHGIGQATVRRAAEFARDVDALADAVGDDARAEILSGSASLTRADVHEAAEALPLAKSEGLVFASPKEAFAWVKEQRSEKAQARREERTRTLVEISNANAPLPEDRRYPVIYADPPWQYDHMISVSREIENQYPTMSIEDICAMNVGSISTPDAMLFLWVPPSFLHKGIRVIEAWGFAYLTSMVWDKIKIGMGYYARQRHEHVLIAYRGTAIVPDPSSLSPSIIAAERGEHSAKPEEFYRAIERMYPELPKIELFARSPRDGWDVWGNQSGEAA